MAGHAHHEESFISKYIFSHDHKMISKQFLVTAIVMGIIAVMLSVFFIVWNSLLCLLFGIILLLIIFRLKSPFVLLQFFRIIQYLSVFLL